MLPALPRPARPLQARPGLTPALPVLPTVKPTARPHGGAGQLLTCP